MVQIVITLLTLSLSSAQQVQHLLQLVHEPFNIIGSLPATDPHSHAHSDLPGFAAEEALTSPIFTSPEETWKGKMDPRKHEGSSLTPP